MLLIIETEVKQTCLEDVSKFEWKKKKSILVAESAARMSESVYEHVLGFKAFSTAGVEIANETTVRGEIVRREKREAARQEDYKTLKAMQDQIREAQELRRAAGVPNPYEFWKEQAEKVILNPPFIADDLKTPGFIRYSEGSVSTLGTTNI